MGAPEEYPDDWPLSAIDEIERLDDEVCEWRACCETAVARNRELDIAGQLMWERDGRLRDENASLRRVAIAAHALRSVFHDSDLLGVALERAEQPWKDILDERLDALPNGVKALWEEED